VKRVRKTVFHCRVGHTSTPNNTCLSVATPNIIAKNLRGFLLPFLPFTKKQHLPYHLLVHFKGSVEDPIKVLANRTRNPVKGMLRR